MKLADVTYLFRWLTIHINIFLITLKFMMTLSLVLLFTSSMIIRSLNRRMEAKTSFKNQGRH